MSGAFSTLENRMFCLLSDGKWHTKEELATECELGDCNPRHVSVYIARLRSKLEVKGKSIQCNNDPKRPTMYRLVMRIDV
jgi:hypothetical protein